MKNLMYAVTFLMCGVQSVHSAEVRDEMIWQYITRGYDEFDTFEDYLRFKTKESHDISIYPKLPEELESHPTIRYFYFKGKLAAYQDCINWATFEPSVD